MDILNRQTHRNMKYLSAFNIAAALFLSTMFFACVPARQVEEMKTNYAKCQEERDAINGEKGNLETELTELQTTHEDMKKQHSGLVTDTTVMGRSLRTMKKQYDKINKLNDELLNKMKELQSGSEAENKQLMIELQALKNELLKREDELKALEKELNARQEDLQAREKRLKELEALIAEKDAKVRDLKNRISEALRAFEGKGLTIEERNGRIYVSMEAKLLFGKGSTVVDQKGKKALIELAKVLEGQKDLHVLVEGHTDTDKITSSSIPRDNWELSVLRATAVVKIMTANSRIDPTQLTAAGRSEYLPVDTGTNEVAMSKNRRIEVVLTPNLDELYEMLEN